MKTSGCLQDESESIRRAFREHSVGTQRILIEQSESNQRGRDQSDFVIPSEPKILCLVFNFKPNSNFRNTAINHIYIIISTSQWPRVFSGGEHRVNG